MAKSKYTPGGFALRVRKSETGKGLFAEEDIPKGACVIEYTGRLVSEEEAERDGGKYLFTVAKNKTIDGNIPSNTARYINHSCRPNCEAIGPSGRVFIFSTRRIKAGEELTYDYGKEYFDQHIAPKGCRCAKCKPRRA
jgi:SET domain-containing protein